MNPSIPNKHHTTPVIDTDDQTWDEYESTRYFLARMRGETPHLEQCSLGSEVVTIGGAA